jgi:lysophospholipase L1-like esterase
MNYRTLLVVFTVLALSHVAAAQPTIKHGDELAICGDSITEQKLYSAFIEDYLTMCRPDLDVRCMQFGWGGETSWGFLARMENDTLRYKPTIATTCYGMNDGGYGPLSQERAGKYRQAMTDVVKKFKDAGVRVVVGSPGCVDSFTFAKSPEKAAVYNKTLAQLRDIAREVASEQHVGFADVYQPMFDAMLKAKEKLGKEYPVCGNDGVHPGANGHLLMAYAFLKSLGCDGEIGTIKVDLGSNTATGSAGHVIKSVDNAKVTVESSRYPFCFFGDPKSPDSTRAIIEFLPFNNELNRFMLVATGGNAAKYTVTWGDASREYTADQLSKGVNLAADFLDNPFSKSFQAVDQLVRIQQNFETPMIKSMIHDIPAIGPQIADQSALGEMATSLEKVDSALATAVRSKLAPVSHTIRIEPAQ